MKPCSLDAWKRAVAEASDPGVQRLQLLLPGMEAEFQAEFHAESHVSAELPDLSVDEAWARNLGRALRVSTESTKSGTDATDATVSATLPGFAGLERKRPVLQSLRASRASAERVDAVDSVDSVDSVDAWVCPGPGQELVQRKMPLPLLRPETVEIQVTHCGLCGSDVHLIDGSWACLFCSAQMLLYLLACPFHSQDGSSRIPKLSSKSQVTGVTPLCILKSVVMRSSVL